ncbi:hypothetical protein MRS76_23705 [Rhizobiaceae bacterium n13]|uniref:Uncharacterized protein n=1 Tax=Ferirhizobium litorale TaxID=2927786 RepID=A0AAE3QJM7_9HYPH|nr:hypothetical protein [Fererhizobium litorale]MDI7864938.1 hypothetical protein [Fererhizobium litorale]MDI7925058.1 hypothetical protein [Fererhizobium litorale]
MRLPGRIDITPEMRQTMLAAIVADRMPAARCRIRACRRHRSCAYRNARTGAPLCFGWLEDGERAECAADLAEAERACRIILGGWKPAPSADPKVRARQDLAVEAATRALSLVEAWQPALVAWLGWRLALAPPLLEEGADLEEYRSFTRYLRHQLGAENCSL